MGYNKQERYFKTLKGGRHQMTITITWQGVVLTLLAAVGIVFLIYLTLLIKKLIGTLKEVDVILKDSQVVTSIAADKATKVDGIIDGVGDAVQNVVDALKGNQNVVKAVTSLVNAVTSLAGMLKKTEKKDS